MNWQQQRAQPYPAPPPPPPQQQGAAAAHPPSPPQQPQPPAPPPAQPAVLGAPQPPATQQQAAPDTQPAAGTEAGYGYASATTAEVVRPQALAVAAPAGAPPTAPGGAGPAQSPPTSDRGHRDWRVRKHRAIPRLRIGTHYAPDHALDQLQLTGASFGFRLGRNQSGLPVALSLFQPSPRTACLIGGVWLAKLVAFRALRLGARVVVSSVEPDGWADLGRAATGRADRVVVLAADMAADVTASAGRPVLRLHDAPHPPAAEQPAPWRTQLTVLRQLVPPHGTVLAQADLVIAQRLTPNETSVAATALRLPPAVAGQLPRLRDDMVATLAGPASEFVWLEPTEPEQTRLGRPNRS
ncbi:hypothetical protein SacmaDRAFT_0239 [Saccharomonospora marina XMU15]|uniref:Uncharacterized protein n=1 Tax=Saccharomonospora marina XMU15 TaxID=882083 RepID=H5X089_9PSEU|nr:hypothetical protein [Saccharomonospora marina]EHR48549.1 hypothetical protein SacmaDRAFT_0239 [Saccharomonospora marina XMU15]